MDWTDSVDSKDLADSTDSTDLIWIWRWNWKARTRTRARAWNETGARLLHSSACLYQGAAENHGDVAILLPNFSQFFPYKSTLFPIKRTNLVNAGLIRYGKGRNALKTNAYRITESFPIRKDAQSHKPNQCLGIVTRHFTHCRFFPFGIHSLGQCTSLVRHLVK